MRVQILCSDIKHPVIPWLERWKVENSRQYSIRIVNHLKDVKPGGILFLISCSEIVPPATREQFSHVFVLHASDLPKGRGWSPLVWELLEGAEQFTLSLIEASNPVDTGRIWAKEHFTIPKTALFPEINASLFAAETRLMSLALRLLSSDIIPEEQSACSASYYPRRRPADNEIEATSSLAESFNIIRVADPVRYPAFFRLHGKKYAIELRCLPDDYPEN